MRRSDEEEEKKHTECYITYYVCECVLFVF
jgi:hypothetical protein